MDLNIRKMTNHPPSPDHSSICRVSSQPVELKHGAEVGSDEAGGRLEQLSAQAERWLRPLHNWQR